MAQSIITKYLGPTNTRGERIKATCWLTSNTVSYSDELSAQENHKAAAEDLLRKIEDMSGLKWTITAAGDTPNGAGYVFIIE